MKKLICVIFGIFISLGLLAQDQVIGMYFTPKKDGKVQIFKEGNTYFGKIVPIGNKGTKDMNNPDPKLRSEPLAGMVFIKNFKYDLDGNWEGGTIYDPNNGKTYSASMWFENNDLSKLHLRGFIGISLLGRTAVFERVK